jgi:hypothetical protein
MNNLTEQTCNDRDPWPLKELIENKHYYMENGLMVLTERYHKSRGKCCGNQCRHCPFDYINVK